MLHSGEKPLMQLPRHIGVIMDGNRRWARANKQAVMMGHNKGAENFGRICDWCLGAGVPYLSVYAFSTENWSRSKGEVGHLFSLMEDYFTKERAQFIEKGVRIKIIGERSRFSGKVLDIIQDIEAATAECANLTVQIALSYGGRDEITRAVRLIAAEYAAGSVAWEEITEDLLTSRLDTADVPDPCLIIRTGGIENPRLSNFMPWQGVYSQLYFSDLLWPDFTHEEFLRAIEAFGRAKVRMGR